MNIASDNWEHHSSDNHRRGATVIEFLAAGALLATVVTYLAPFVSRVAIVNESITDREFALREVQNLIVELQQGSTSPKLSEEVISRLEAPQLNIERTPQKDSQAAKVTVSVSWINQFGEPHSPVSLSFWQFSGGAEE